MPNKKPYRIIECPICNTKLRETRRDSHIQKVHGHLFLSQQFFYEKKCKKCSREFSIDIRWKKIPQHCEKCHQEWLTMTTANQAKRDASAIKPFSQLDSLQSAIARENEYKNAERNNSKSVRTIQGGAPGLGKRK